MKRYAIFLFGIIAYLVGAGAYFGGIIGFLSGLLPGKTAPFGEALLINVGLMVLWGILHSLMARKGFKRWWIRIVPKAMERSIYMLQAGLLMALLIWQWRAMPGLIWQVENPAGRGLIWGLFGLGMTAYILIGLRFEERDLLRRFDDRYRAYQAKTPMLIPALRLGKGSWKIYRS